MAETIAAILLLLGSAVVLIAALGVGRLPDAFLRMHAATKAGVVGAGTVLLAAGFAFNTMGAWLTVVFAIAFLLLTTPIASHLLGRAAYVAGAPLWRGTVADHLEGVLSRRGLDRAVISIPDLDRRPTMSTASAVHTLQPSGASDTDRYATRVRRLLAVLSPGPGGDFVLDHALEIARGHGAVLTGLSLVDVPKLAAAGPIPIGGAAYARQRAESRLSHCRERTATLLERMEGACRADGLPYGLRHEEGDAASVIEGAAGTHDLILIAADSGFCDGDEGDPLKAALRLLARDVRPVAVAAGPVRPVRRIGFWHDGSPRAARTLHWLSQLAPWPRATVQLIGVGGDAGRMEELMADSAAMLAAHGRNATVNGVVASPAELSETLSLGRAPDVVVVGNAGSVVLPTRLTASATLRPLAHPDRLVILG